MPRPIIALTTDFGPSSPYVAEMKGVILSALPDVQLVDVTHAIPARSVRHAEVVLRDTAFSFPLGTVHVVVVDPGVGTSRRPIAVWSRGCGFVGPDNGVLGVTLAQPGAETVVLDQSALFRQPVSRTFHGRDIFAPVAAELAAGLPLAMLGSLIEDALPSTLPQPFLNEDCLRGESLMADSFGNLLTNVPGERLSADWRVRVAGQLAQWVSTYQEGKEGVLLALVGSAGYLEIAVRDGSAAVALGQDVGLRVECVRSTRE